MADSPSISRDGLNSSKVLLARSQSPITAAVILLVCFALRIEVFQSGSLSSLDYIFSDQNSFSYACVSPCAAFYDAGTQPYVVSGSKDNMCSNYASRWACCCTHPDAGHEASPIYTECKRAVNGTGSNSAG